VLQHPPALANESLVMHSGQILQGRVGSNATITLTATMITGTHTYARCLLLVTSATSFLQGIVYGTPVNQGITQPS
jgi:hypothetical protein